MNTFLVAYLGSASIAVVLTPLVIRLACRVGAIDRPGPRAAHQRPTPRIGGLAIFLSATCLIATLLLLNTGFGESAGRMERQWITLFCSATFIFLVGLVDDLRALPARWKLLAELIAAAALCCAGVRIDSIAVADGLVLRLGGWGALLTLLWIVGVTNAVNLSDGLDGLAAGISTITCGMIAAFAIGGDNPVLAVLMLALAGSLSGFLLFNFHPAKVFMGDCGSLFLGFTIAASSVMCVAKSAALVGLTLPALALGVPIFDTLFSMLRRFCEGRSLFAADRSHFHHRLLDLGLHQRHAVILIYLATLLATGLGLFMLLREDLGSIIIFACVLFLIALLFRAVGAVRLTETFARLREKHACSAQERRERYTFEHLQLCVRQVRGPDEWWRTICQAAEELEVAWVSMSVVHPDGSADTTVWRGQNVPTTVTGVITVETQDVASPLTPGAKSVHFEMGVLVNGSLESAGRRATLLGRLIRCLEFRVYAGQNSPTRSEFRCLEFRL